MPLVVFLGICFSLLVVGEMVTATSVDTWYQSLNKPVFNPPDSVFAPVWTLLYLMIAIAGWRIWRTQHI